MPEDFTTVIPYITLVAVFVVVATISYNLSRKMTKMELDNKALKEQHAADIAKLEKQIIEASKDNDITLERLKLERNELIAKTVGNQKHEFEAMQKQLDAQKADIKDLLSTIKINDTKIKTHDETINAIFTKFEHEKEFMTKWIQRVEDRIEAVKKTFDNFVNMILLRSGLFSREPKNGNT